MVKRLFHVLLLIRLTLTCDYVAPTDDEVMVANTEYPQGERKKREAAWDWIRIETEYDASFNLTSFTCHGRQ
ncbi:hypothetical protein COOONC_07722 [Cooperia oncophora]